MNNLVIQRLGLIKTAVALEDEEVIAMQVGRLREAAADERLAAILAALEAHHYDRAMLEIEQYLGSGGDMVAHEDPELMGLRMKLKTLETRLRRLDARKREYLQLVNDFNSRHALCLGGLIMDILRVRREIAEIAGARRAQAVRVEQEHLAGLEQRLARAGEEKKRLAAQLEDADDATFDDILARLKQARAEWQKLRDELAAQRQRCRRAEEEFEQETEKFRAAADEQQRFRRQYQQARENRPCELSREEQQELKKLYRRACRFCHPDIVADELKQQAEEVIKRLNNAYARRDIGKVREILVTLESEGIFVADSDAQTDRERLRARITILEDKIAALEQELAEITAGQTWQLVQGLDDWDAYFAAMRGQLQQELREYEAILQKEKDAG